MRTTTRRLISRLLLSLTACALPALGDTVSTPDGGTYTGPLVDGRLHGRGRIVWESGATYEGEFANGQMSGRGRLVQPDGSISEGIFRHGALNGEGRQEMPDGTVYSGWFRHGVLHGRGRYAGPDGEYEGSFRDGRLSGRGELRTPAGARYRGEFAAGRFEGKGRFESASGDIYEGEFVADQFNGKGRATRPDGSRHEGSFRDWLPEGPGRFVSPDGSVFEGRFSGGVMSGHGHITYPDGSRYEGQVEAWLPHGQGALHFANGDHFEGGFSEGQPDGEGVMRLAAPEDGRQTIRGIWRQGQRLDPAAEQAGLERMEQLIYGEPERLRRALADLAPGNPDAVEMYLLTVAGDGSQEVFRRETTFIRRQFDTRFATAGRSLGLTNTRHAPAADPIATRTSIRQAIEGIAATMNRDQDILFLYLSSHGSPEHALSLTQPRFDLADLDAAELGEILRASGIRWRVVVVSACYAGGFIAPLDDPGTLVITAARHDRRSFGCADENAFTYFGRAFFQDALPRSDSFQEAFTVARALVRQREIALLSQSGQVSEQDFSLPQIVAPLPITRHLETWWHGLPRQRAVATRDD